MAKTAEKHPIGSFNHIGRWLMGDPESGKDGLLTQKNISVEQLARAAGLTRYAIYLYIHDKRRPSTEAMRRICKVLGVPPEEGMRQFTPSKLGRPAHKTRRS